MKFSLRSLVLAAVFGPPMLAGAWKAGVKLLARPPHDSGARSLCSFPVTTRIIIQPEEEARLGLNVEEP
ncbi:MAG: hypothetical protein K8R36_13610 [Planctomycetales bacterium]|nr:hypothetical protein [Planctomycetales bacterium]